MPRDMHEPRCSTCHQPIREGEEAFVGLNSIAEHIYASDCVAAAVRRCVEIADGKSKEWWTEYRLGAYHRADPHYQGKSDGADEIVMAIRAGWPEVRP